LSGDLRSTELMHRPFVWTYWLVSSLTAGRAFSMLAGTRLQVPTWVAPITIAGLLPVAVWYGSGVQHGNWGGAAAFSSPRVDRGLVECAQYIRGQLPTTAIAQDAHFDNLLVLSGLSERPSFAARPELWKVVSKAFRDSAYQQQLGKLQALQQAINIADLQHSVRETGIRWYVFHPGDSNVWPTEFRDHPAFESNGYRVYDMKRCFDLRG